MVDTRLLHAYSKVARAKKWRTVLVGDHRQLDAVDAGGMFAELVHDRDVVTVELDTLHRFEHRWEAAASLALRVGDATALDLYDSHNRLHGHVDQAETIDAVVEAAVTGIAEDRNVLVMAATNAVVDTLNQTITDRLLDVGLLDQHDVIEIGGSTFHVGQPVVTRANDRTFTYCPDAGVWVRNGDRWTVDAGTRDELYVTNRDNGHRHAIPASYIAAGNVTVDYASTINRAQGATVDEAHVIIDERTNAKQLYVAMTRGRDANHVHTAPPAFDLEHHGPTGSAEEWTPTISVARALQRQPDHVSAIARRRQLRDAADDALSERLDNQPASPFVSAESVPGDEASERVAAVMRRFQSLTRRPSQGLGR